MAVVAFRNFDSKRPRARREHVGLSVTRERLLDHLRQMATQHPDRYCHRDECLRIAGSMSDGSLRTHIHALRDHLWQQGDRERIECRHLDGYRLVRANPPAAPGSSS